MKKEMAKTSMRQSSFLATRRRRGKEEKDPNQKAEEEIEAKSSKERKREKCNEGEHSLPSLACQWVYVSVITHRAKESNFNSLIQEARRTLTWRQIHTAIEGERRWWSWRRWRCYCWTSWRSQRVVHTWINCLIDCSTVAKCQVFHH